MSGGRVGINLNGEHGNYSITYKGVEIWGSIISFDV
jgi:hypothetical protein